MTLIPRRPFLENVFRLLRSRYGFCPVCHSGTLFLIDKDLDTIRGHAVCIRCRCVSRHRHLALCILAAFQDRGIVRLGDFRDHVGLAVYSAGSGSPVVRAMASPQSTVVSEYFDDCAPGGLRNGVLCQNLEKLTFGDGSFDLAVTEDVFEHVLDWRSAFREMHRVLKPGGQHIFTVPFYFDERTHTLFDLVEGKAMFHEPVEYHGDPIRGSIPAATHFGYDLFEFLGSIGFEARVQISNFADDVRYGTFNSYTFITRKR